MTASPGPDALAGVRVIDFTRVFSGPFAAQTLGEFGADIIKVERLNVGDESRDYGVTEEMPRPGAAFLAYNRNKRSIAIDLKSEEGRDTAKRIIRTADVVLHNFRPGVMERLGLAYEDLRDENLGLIYCSISGYGKDSSLRDRAANDLQIQAYSSLLSMTGDEGGGPVRNPLSVCDLTAGLYAVIGILAALNYRTVSGEGQEIAVSMLEGQLGMLNHFLVDYWMTGHIPPRMGTANELGLPNQAFVTKDGFVAMSSANEGMYRRACDALGISELKEDPRFRSLRDRYANREELVRRFEEATSAMTTAEAVERLSAAGVSNAPVNTLDQLAADPILDELDATLEMETENHGAVKLVRVPVGMSVTRPVEHRAPPRLGEHTDEILREAGLDERQIKALRRSSAVG